LIEQLRVCRLPHYAIWVWKADYWNLGAGAEIGIYYQENQRKADLGFYDIDTDLKVHAVINVDYYPNGPSGAVVHLTPTPVDQENWWITTFTPRIQRPNIDYLYVWQAVDFVDTAKHPNLLAAFDAKYNGDEPPELSWSGGGSGWAYLNNVNYDFYIKY